MVKKVESKDNADKIQLHSLENNGDLIWDY